MSRDGDSDLRSDAELASLTPPTRSDDWAATTGQIREVIRTPGSHVGPYIVLEQLGLGGMGVVYSAYDPKLDRKVALKVLRSQGHDETAAVARLRLVSEGRALARVSHGNVVTVYDVGTLETEVYVAMELIEGQTLGQWRKGAPRAWPETTALFAGIAAGLIAVHESGLIHRDVKPDNILIDAEGTPKVTDFGLARPEHDAPESLQRREQALIDADVPVERLQLTQTGARLGTPAYMACELLGGKPASPLSDQFAFCVTLWETLYGDRPFEGGSWVSLVMSVTQGQIREPPTATSTRPVPRWLRRIIERGLAPDPQQRWPSMRALRDALQAGDPARVRRRWWLGAGALSMAAAVTAGFVVHDRRARRIAESECTEAGQRVHAVWSEGTRARLRDAFGRSSIDGAMEIEGSVESVIDAFAGAWAEQRASVCMAALEEDPEPLLARREDCLEQRLEVMGSLVETFARGGDVTVSRARRTSESLADLGVCSDTARLARMPPRPQDDARRERARNLERGLMQTLVHEHLGHYDEGLRRTRSMLAQAEDLEHMPTSALAHYRVAVFEEKLGNYEPAVEQWVTAFRQASLSGDDDLAAQSASALAFAEGFQLGRHDAGIRWAQLCGILLERLGKTMTLDEARRLDVLAVLTESKGDYDQAVGLHRRSLALRESLVPDTHQSIGYGLANLAGVLQNQGKLAEAEQTLLRARSIFDNAFGADNPTTAHVVHNLAGLYQEQQRYEEALQLHQQVLDNWTARLGPDHPDVGDVHRAMGDAALARERLDVAVGHYRHALRAHAQASATGQPAEHAKSALRLAEALVLQGGTPEASERFEEALSAAGNSPDRLRGRARLGLGWLAYDRGDLHTARAHFERARGLFEVDDDDAQPWLARTRVALAALDAEHDAPGASSAWRALADDGALAPSVRAEALSWLTRVSGASADDQQSLTDLLAQCSPADALRIRTRHES